MDNVINEFLDKKKMAREKRITVTQAPPFPFGKTVRELEETLIKLRPTSKKAKQITSQLKYWRESMEKMEHDDKKE